MPLLRPLTRGFARRGVEVACLPVGVFLAGFFTWYACDMLWFSFITHDVSQGLVPVPLWIPQTGMALGLAILLVALLDDLLVVVSRGTPSYDSAEANASALER